MVGMLLIKLLNYVTLCFKLVNPVFIRSLIKCFIFVSGEFNTAFENIVKMEQL